MDELLNEFLTETNESLSELDGEIVKLEQAAEAPASAEPAQTPATEEAPVAAETAGSETKE